MNNANLTNSSRYDFVEALASTGLKHLSSRTVLDWLVGFAVGLSRQKNGPVRRPHGHSCMDDARAHVTVAEPNHQ
jgi:hypothetical protein